MNVAAPALVERLKAEGVDALIVAPACPLDHQHGGLVARVAEEAGIPTVSVITGRDISASTNVPRAVWSNSPMGTNFVRAAPPPAPAELRVCPCLALTRRHTAGTTRRAR